MGGHDHAPHLVGVVGLAEREQGGRSSATRRRGDLPRHPVLALVGERVPPRLGLGVQIGEIPEGAPRPEVRPEVFDRVFHAPLLVPFAHVAGHRAEAVVARVGQEARVEADELPPPLGHRRREVVVPDLLRAAAHEGEGLLVAAQEGLEGLAEGEGHREEPGVAQHQDEGVDGPADAEDVAELAPVDLRGLARPKVSVAIAAGAALGRSRRTAPRSALIPPR